MRRVSKKTREELLFEADQSKVAEKHFKDSFERYRKRVYSTFFKNRLDSCGVTAAEKNVFLLFWGFDGNEPTVGRDIAVLLGLHPVSISQSAIKATKKMMRDSVEVPVEKKSVLLKRVKGERTFLNLRAGDFLVTPRATIVKVLSANGNGEGRVYNLSREVREPDPEDEGLKSFSEALTAFELADRGYTVLV